MYLKKYVKTLHGSTHVMHGSTVVKIVPFQFVFSTTTHKINFRNFANDLSERLSMMSTLFFRMVIFRKFQSFVQFPYEDKPIHFLLWYTISEDIVSSWMVVFVFCTNSLEIKMYLVFVCFLYFLCVWGGEGAGWRAGCTRHYI